MADALCHFAVVALAEFLNPTRRIHQLLFTRIEGMTHRADLNAQIVGERGAGYKTIAASTLNFNVLVLGVNVFFHGILIFRNKGARL